MDYFLDNIFLFFSLVVFWFLTEDLFFVTLLVKVCSFFLALILFYDVSIFLAVCTLFIFF